MKQRSRRDFDWVFLVLIMIGAVPSMVYVVNNISAVAKNIALVVPHRH